MYWFIATPQIQIWYITCLHHILDSHSLLYVTIPIGGGLEMEIKTRDDEKCVSRIKSFVTNLVPSMYLSIYRPIWKYVFVSKINMFVLKTTGVRLQEDFGGKLRYSLPRMAPARGHGRGEGGPNESKSTSDTSGDEETVTLSRLFGEIERVRASLEIDDYAISQTTLEQVPRM
jgi:hypothetical protein